MSRIGKVMKEVTYNSSFGMLDKEKKKNKKKQKKKDESNKNKDGIQFKPSFY